MAQNIDMTIIGAKQNGRAYNISIPRKQCFGLEKQMIEDITVNTTPAMDTQKHIVAILNHIEDQ